MTEAKKKDEVPSRDEALEEVRKIREENEKRASTHDRVVVSREVETVSGSLQIDAADGRVYVTSDDAVLDQTGVINAQQALAAAFQAVS